MKVRILGCYGGQLAGFSLTSLLVDGELLIDCGAATSTLTLEEQHGIRSIFITHTHLDHIKDIAFLADNRSLKNLVASNSYPHFDLYGSQWVIDVLKQDFLNDRIWPDFTKIPTLETGILKLHPVPILQPHDFGSVRLIPVPVNHPVPTTGVILDDGNAQLVFTADSGPTDPLWEAANKLPNLKGVIIDTSFPNRYRKLALISGHPTPETMADEVRKLSKDVPVYLTHMKPETLDTLLEEVYALDLPNVRPLRQGETLVL